LCFCADAADPMFSHSVKRYLYLAVLVFCAAWFLIGCRQGDVKADADEDVYRIIDGKWADEYGSKVNYKVSDTTPAGNSLDVKRQIPASGVLGADDAVAIATAHNRQYQSRREDLYLRALNLRLIRHDFERQYFGQLGQSYSEEADEESLGVDGTFGFSRLLGNGTAITTAVSQNWLDILTGDVQGGLSSIFQATVVKPLLRGSDPNIVQERLTQSERNVLYEVRSFNRFRKDFVIQVLSEYYRVLQLRDEWANAQSNYEKLGEIYARARKLAEYGRLPQHELAQARQDKLSAQDLMIDASQEYEDALDLFKLTLSISPSVEFELDEAVLTSLKDNPIDKPSFGVRSGVDTALAGRLDVANAADRVDDARRKVNVAADQLKGDLNLSVGVGVSNERDTDLTGLRTSQGDINADLRLDLPLEREAAKNQYRQAQIEVTRAMRQYEQRADTVQLEVRNAYRQLQARWQQYQVQQQSLASAQDRVEKTLKLLQYRRANTRDVLDAQDDLLDAKNAATAALVDYTIATLNFYRDVGVLQVRPDGMWQVEGVATAQTGK